MRATRTSEIGPLKGISETAIAADAASPAKLSGMCSVSAEIKDTTTCVSLWKSSGNIGRKARSIKRETKISSSYGRASRLK